MDVHLGLHLYQKRKAETETKEGKMKRVQEEIRKGPWTEQEDVVLVNFVHLFGDRRWDFIAKVSGLNRTGKSCRLRWVNYLHPGLKRGKMTTQEERLVLELHAKWGNRWSRIARKLPGRTDNEIKNYWRTHMRKKAQDMKRAAFQRSPSVNSPCSASTITTADSMPSQDTGKVSFYDTGGLDMTSLTDKKKREQVEEEKGYSMDDIWKDIDQLSEENNNTKTTTIYDNYSDDNVCGFSYPLEASPAWEFCWDSLWRMDEEEGSKINCFTNKDSFI